MSAGRCATRQVGCGLPLARVRVEVLVSLLLSLSLAGCGEAGQTQNGFESEPRPRVVVLEHPDGSASPVLLYPADCFDPERREKWSAPECQGAETRRASY